LESGLFNYTLTRSPGTAVEAYAVNALSVRVGLFSLAELQLNFDSFDWQSTRQQGLDTVRASGFGDVLLRAKISVLGNDQGSVCVGLIPKVKVPTSPIGNHRAEEGLHVPIAIDLAGLLNLGLMPEWDHRLNMDGVAYHQEWLGAAVLSAKVAGELSAFAQYEMILSSEAGVGVNAAAGFGTVYKIARDWQLDAGLNFGITASAPERNFSLGLVARY
jgi:hypothetical protein